MNNLLDHLSARWKGKTIAVIGDVILDQHIQGQVHRISPEAPVPIVLQQGEPSYTPGGAANVACNLAALGAHPVLVGRVGDDLEGRVFLSQLRKKGLTDEALLIDPDTPTIIKTRIMARHQQVLRLDREKPTGLSATLRRRLKSLIKSLLKRSDAVIISDYGKGLLDEDILQGLVHEARCFDRILTVDPKVEHFLLYHGVTAITPNRFETENAIRNIKIAHRGRRRLQLHNDKLRSEEDILEAGRELRRFLDLDGLLITLGEEGMALFERRQRPWRIQTAAREVYDVTGAGDTVIAVFTLGLCAGTDMRTAAMLANLAAGVVVGKMGPATVSPEELAAQVQWMQPSP